MTVLRRQLNPPPLWVHQAVLPALAQLDVPPEWLPIEKAPDLLDDELGCGLFGCVLTTADPNVVIKVTSDPDESRFVEAMLALGDAAPYEGLVRYYALQPTGYTRRWEVYRKKPDGLGGYTEVYVGMREDPVYMLWREVALHVGISEAKLRPARPAEPAPMPPRGGLAEALLMAEYAEGKRKAEAGEGWGSLYPETFEEWLAERSDWHQRQRQRYERELAEWEATRWFSSQELKDLGELYRRGVYPYYLSVRRLGEARDPEPYMAEEAAAAARHIASLGTPDAEYISSTLVQLADMGVFLNDLHPGNFGLVRRPEGERWVITDPGKALFVPILEYANPVRAC